MSLSVDLSFTNLVLLGFLVFAAKKLWKLWQKGKVNKMLEKWDSSPIRDKVILHTLWKCKTLPSISPFGMKLETYLRMTKIPYELDHKDPSGPRGKIPWITYNGAHISDSHLCIQFLNKKFSVNLNKNCSKEQVSAARACRIMLEDRSMWGILRFRWIENLSDINDLIKMPTIFKYTSFIIANQTRSRMEQNGIGMHTPTEINHMTEQDIRTVSTVLGSKKFLGGDVPCEEDCSVFGVLAQALWAAPGSSFEKLINDELVNLKNYCERMKHLYWPDWQSCLDQSY